MIERKFIKEKMKELKVKEYLKKRLGRVGFSRVEMVKTPFGYKVIIYASRPGLVVGRRGANVQDIERELKEFGLESPSIEVRDVENPYLDAQIVADRVANQVIAYGGARIKAIGNKNLNLIMESGARGAEIIINGRTGQKSNRWRFYAGYLPKTGEVVERFVRHGFKEAMTKLCVMGVTVNILPSNVMMPDRIYLKGEEVGNTKEMGNKKNEERRPSKETK